MEAGAVFVVPLRVGGGTRLKIFEAMAMGRPLASTSIGAEGLPITDGIHGRIADGAEGFSAAVLDLLTEPERAAAVALTAAAYVRSEFGWDRVASKFVELVSEDRIGAPSVPGH
jgi:glycosyltransferase involved in cell wall biosynthesis